jgi:hypothetical protein
MSDLITPEQVDAIHQFARSAEAFCALMENQKTLSNTAFTKQCAAALAALIHDGIAMPPVDSDFYDVIDDDDEALTTVDTHRTFTSPQIYQAVIARFKTLDSYHEWFDSYDTDSAVTTSLSDDLDDIYADMRRGLEYYRIGTDNAVLRAALEWQIHFSHWGEHVTGALKPLFWIMARDLLADDEPRS